MRFTRVVRFLLIFDVESTVYAASAAVEACCLLACDVQRLFRVVPELSRLLGAEVGGYARGVVDEKASSSDGFVRDYRMAPRIPSCSVAHPGLTSACAATHTRLHVEVCALRPASNPFGMTAHRCHRIGQGYC